MGLSQGGTHIHYHDAHTLFSEMTHIHEYVGRYTPLQVRNVNQAPYKRELPVLWEKI
jgi:hypothetical protein